MWRAWRPPSQVILPYSGHALQKEPKEGGGGRGGGRPKGQRSKDEDAEKWKNVGGRTRGEEGPRGGGGDSFRTFLQIVLLQILAG